MSTKFPLIAGLLVLFVLWVFLQPGSANKKMQQQNGRKVYETHCLACHMQKGEGVHRMAPPLAGSPLVLGGKPKLIKIVLNGSDELTDLPARSYRNPMAAMDYLTDKEIADVLTFIRQNFGNKGSSITAAEVKNVRVAN